VIQADEFLPPIHRGIRFGGLVAIGLVGAAIALSSVIKYKVTVKAPATIRPAGELRLVQAATEGTVTQIAVKLNQRIKQGEVIARIDDARLQTKKRQLHSSIQQSQLQLTQIAAQITALDRQIAAETNRSARAVAAAESDLAGRQREHHDRQITSQAEVQEAIASLRAAEASLSTARVKFTRYQPVVAAGALSQDRLTETHLEVQQQEQAVAAAQAKLERARTALEPNAAAVAIAAARITQEQATGQSSLATLAKEREALIQRQIEVQSEQARQQQELHQVDRDLQQTTIAATADGIVLKLNLRNAGQAVRPGEEIAQIVPSQAALQILAAVAPPERDKLKVGQPVQMRVSACPYPDFGTLKGSVTQISEDTIKPSPSATADADGSSAKPFYEVTIAPDRPMLEWGRHRCALEVGMEGNVDITTREETVLRFVLRKARILTDL
jgi:HlyD family type I secretion membrane fusion protein